MSTNFQLNSIKKILPYVLFASACLCQMNLSQAQDRQDNHIEQRGDPQRWYQEKDTPEAYFATLKKEAYAVYQEAIAECKSVGSAEKKQCTKDAKTQLQQDLTDAKINSKNIQ